MGRTVWDWASKMGAGAVILWFVQRWFGKRDKAVERGQTLVENARPELIPMGNVGSQYVVGLMIENRGTGLARTLRIGFTGVSEIPSIDEVPPGQSRQAATLNVQGAPFFTSADDSRGDICLVYADRYGNEYSLLIPVTRRSRADGTFNMEIHTRDYKTLAPKLSKARLRGIGGV